MSLIYKNLQNSQIDYEVSAQTGLILRAYLDKQLAVMLPKSMQKKSTSLF